LKSHLHTLPEHPDWIPYRVSYYRESWGFCLTHRALEQFEDGNYEVFIDSSLSDGHLTIAECLIEGDTPDEILLFTHICHPAMANDNLSGMALLTFVAQALRSWSNRRYTYRIVFAPTTLGSIAWLARNVARLKNVRHGLVVSLAGDPGGITYKRTRAGDAPVDRAAAHVLKHRSGDTIIDFVPYGYDERQFCSPGVNLAVGRLTRTPNAQFAQYHTSADNLDFVQPQYLADTFNVCTAVLGILEHDERYVNLSPMGEPRLGPRGLYSKTSADRDVNQVDLAMLWVLNLSDGQHSLLDIAERSGLPFAVVQLATNALVEAGLLRREQR
jgi:aminopeptidase-like protein